MFIEYTITHSEISNIIFSEIYIFYRINDNDYYCYIIDKNLVKNKGESRCKEVNTMEGLLSQKGNSVISLHSIIDY